MRELLEYLAQNILPHGDEVEVTKATADDDTVKLTLTTHPDDTGLAIGKGGKTAHALREVIKIKAMQEGKRVYLDIRSSDEISTGDAVN